VIRLRYYRRRWHKSKWFSIGDKVVDVTAELNDWLDKDGEIIDIDGSNIKVKYESGVVRWKKDINLRKRS
jgi:hypothetical protein